MTEPATIEEIVAYFNTLKDKEILRNNWSGVWPVNDETYINGVLMTLDFDYMMGYFIQAVDRTTSDCRYIAILQKHGRAKDGSIEHEFEVAPEGHVFFAKEFNRVRIVQWGVAAIYRMVGYPDTT